VGRERKATERKQNIALVGSSIALAIEKVAKS